jgi:hypothetical protein
VRAYEGLKYVDDRHDARWLARLLQLGILPTGYIYPKQQRALRDLLRRRAFLVRQRTANLLSIKNLCSRQTRAQGRWAFCSYCRCVPSQHLSNGKVKGEGQYSQRESLPVLGLHRGRTLRHPVRAAVDKGLLMGGTSSG